MELRPLGRTGLQVSRIAFGAGPIPAVMTSGSSADRVAVLRRAVDAGVNWIDTAAGYGAGQSEASIGETLAELGATDVVQVATKFRLSEADFENVEAAIRKSLSESLTRLRTHRVAVLQLHNAITWQRDLEPSSVSVDDVLGKGGIADALERIVADNCVAAVGFTGAGQASALREVISSGRFQTIQAPFNLLNPSAGRPMPADFRETNYGNLFELCARQQMGVFAIRVFAGGALAGLPPGPHTLQTRYFPLDLYHRDQVRTETWRRQLASQGIDVKEAAVRFAISHPAVTSAIIGLSTPDQVDEAVRYAKASDWTPADWTPAEW